MPTSDVIAVVRGGGDRTDLLAFDLASVAKAVAMCPLPVFCGIGHETDTSVVDQVAHTAAKTPTACASALVAHVAAFDERLARTRREVDRLARSRAAAAAARLTAARSALGLLAERRLARPRARLGEIRLRLGHHAQRHCGTAASKLAGARRALQRSPAHAQRAMASLGSRRPRLQRASTRRLEAAKARLRSASALVSAVAPERTLARGFSITRAADGSIVREMPAAGDTISTQTQRAVFASVVDHSRTTSPQPGEPADDPTTGRTTDG